MTEVHSKRRLFSVDFYLKNLRTGGIIIAFFYTKSRSNSQAPEDVLPACQTTLKNLQLKYLDLYLVSHKATVDKTSHKNKHLRNALLLFACIL